MTSQLLEERVTLAGNGVLTHCRLKHPGGTLGLRVDWPGKSLAYITDTSADGSAHTRTFFREWTC